MTRTIQNRRKPLNYQYYKKTELARFAANRGLNVTSTAKKPRNGPSQTDYVRALKQADNDFAFRFLDLPPEMRNMIYRELLVFKESWYCHPQILATCRQVNEEATSILYADNLIKIKIYADGVFTHGKRCGDYSPGYPYRSLDPPAIRDFRQLAWPAYLHRVQHLRIAVVELTWNRKRMASISNSVASVCSTLASDHSLRSLHVDIQRLSTNGVQGNVETVLYPLRLLRKIPSASVTSGYGEATMAPFLAAMRQDAVEKVSPALCWSVAAEIYHCAQTCASLGLLARPALSDMEPIELHILPAMGKGLLFHGFCHCRKWEDEYSRYVDRVRARYERIDPIVLSQGFVAEAEEVLRKGIDLRLKQKLSM